jgi:hypothetical protein
MVDRALPQESIHCAGFTVKITNQVTIGRRIYCYKRTTNLIISSFYVGHLYQLQEDK